MASPQKENGYTPIANEILEKLVKVKLNGTQFRIILDVLRNTYGYSRKECALSQISISKDTGIARPHICREMQLLYEMKILTIVQEATFKKPAVIAFNKNYSVWATGIENPPVDRNVTATGNGLGTTTGNGLGTLKDKQDLKQDLKQDPPPTMLGLEGQSDSGGSAFADNDAKENDENQLKNKKRYNADMPKRMQELFDAFWTAYPRKASKGDARKAWKQLDPSSELLTKMLTSLGRAKTCEQWIKEGGKYIPHPAKWLRAEGWEDEIALMRTPAQTKGDRRES